MSEDCEYCDNPVNPYDIGVWKQVKGWVTGPKAHGMTLREDTGKYAHNACINKARAGQAPDQPTLTDDTNVILVSVEEAKKDTDLAKLLFDDK